MGDFVAPAAPDKATSFPPTKLCNQCQRKFAFGDKFFRCVTCTDDGSNICKQCVLSVDHDFNAHKLQPCLLDPRDGRITRVSGPTDEEFRDLAALAKSDVSFKFPFQVKKFLADSEDLPGLTVERLNASESYETETSIEHESARTRMVQNDYSLYEPLDKQKREIRIALLLQGPVDSPINIAIVRMSYPWTQRGYVALSYRWGPLDETRPIYIGHAERKVGEEESEGLRYQKLECTANLEIALRSLRREDHFLAFWIDAICINQADPSERAYQVGIMSEIFANASSVCVFLGLEYEEAVALRCINAMAMQRGKAYARKQISESHSAVQIVRDMIHRGSFTLDKSELSRERVLEMMSRFFKNPWFSRVWVLQEVWSARGDVLVWVAGGMMVPWDDILFAHLYISVAFHDLRSTLAGLHQPWPQLEKVQHLSGVVFPRLPLLDLFEGICQNFDATDTRDMLFGLLAMAQEVHDISSLPPLIAPNYNKPAAQVFIDFTKWCLLTSRSLKVLGYVSYMVRGPVKRIHNSTLPSWSLSPQPKFRTHGTKLCEVPEFQACASVELDNGLRDGLEHSTSLSLPLRGYRLDKIERADKMYFLSRWDQQNDLYIMNDETQTYYSGGIKYIWSQFQYDGRPMWDCCPLVGMDSCSCQIALDKFLITLTCGGMREHAACDHANGIHRTKWYTPSDMYKDFAAHWVSKQKTDPDNGGDGQMKLFCPHVRDILLPIADEGKPDDFSQLLQNASRKVFATISVGGGLCPLGTREGDVVVALFGGKAPFVLRKHEGKEAWAFIGECYFENFMDGTFLRKLQKQGQESEVFELV